MSGPRPIPGFYYDPQSNRYYRIPRSAAASPVAQMMSRERDEAQRHALEELISRSILPVQTLDRTSGRFSSTVKTAPTARQSRPRIVRGEGPEELRLAVMRRRAPTPVVLSHPAGNSLLPTHLVGTAVMFIPSPDTRVQVAAVVWQDDPNRAVRALQIVNYPSRRVDASSVDRGVPSLPEIHRIGRPPLAPRLLLMIEHSGAQKVISLLEGEERGELRSRAEPLVSLTGAPTASSRVASSRDGRTAFISWEEAAIHRLEVRSGSGERHSLVLAQRYDVERMVFSLACKETVMGAERRISLLVGYQRGRIVEMGGPSKSQTTYRLPEGQCASRIWHLPDSCRILVETFHGKVFMFDERFPASCSLLFDPESIDAALRRTAFLHEVDVDNEILYSATRDSGVIIARDLRAVGDCLAAWKVERPLKSIFMQPTRADGSTSSLHVFVD